MPCVYGRHTLDIDPQRGLRAARRWRAQSLETAGPQFLGHIVHHIVQDPRDAKVLLMAAKTGHLGPTVFRSADRGRTWHEAAQPPAFRKAAAGEEARAVQRVFWLTPGHASEPGTWYAGTSPAGLFRSQDGVRRLTAAGLAKLLDQDESLGSVVLVDVREPREFDAGHLAGAINIPVSDLR